MKTGSAEVLFVRRVPTDGWTQLSLVPVTSSTIEETLKQVLSVRAAIPRDDYYDSYHFDVYLRDLVI